VRLATSWISRLTAFFSGPVRWAGATKVAFSNSNIPARIIPAWSRRTTGNKITRQNKGFTGSPYHVAVASANTQFIHLN
jgi:hypothetical protein